MAIKHGFTSAIADDPATAAAGGVLPSHWNASHVIDNGSITKAMIEDLANSTLLGRNTAGAGAPEEVTASQLFDWVSNTDGVLLTRAAGTWGAVANVTTDGGDLVFAHNASPTTPAAGVKVFAQSLAGRVLPAFITSSGGDKAFLQTHFGRRRVIWWAPRPGGSAFDAQGGAPVTQGTATVRTAASTNMASSACRVGMVSAASAGSVTGLRYNNDTIFWRGNGPRLGGFLLLWRFCISDGALVPTARMFAGLRTATGAPTDVDPSTLSNVLGVGCDSGDTVLQLYAAGASAQARVSLGANFPVDTVSTDIYEVALFAAPNDSQVSWEVTRVNTGDTATGTITAAASLPSSTTFLSQTLYRSNGGTASAVAVDFYNFYAEVDV